MPVHPFPAHPFIELLQLPFIQLLLSMGVLMSLVIGLIMRSGNVYQRRRKQYPHYLNERVENERNNRPYWIDLFRGVEPPVILEARQEGQILQPFYRILYRPAVTV